MEDNLKDNSKSLGLMDTGAGSAQTLVPERKDMLSIPATPAVTKSSLRMRWASRALSSDAEWERNLTQEASEDGSRCTDVGYESGVRSGDLDVEDEQFAEELFGACDSFENTLSQCEVDPEDEFEIADTVLDKESQTQMPSQRRAKKPKYTVVEVYDESSGTSKRVDAASSIPVASDVAGLALRNTNAKAFKFPWERGRLGAIFSDKPLVRVPDPSLLPGSGHRVQLQLQVSEGSRMEAALQLQMVPSSEAIFVHAVKNMVGGSYVEERKSRRALAVKLWWDLLCQFLEHSDPGRAVDAESSTEEMRSSGFEILDACFAVKSPATLLKRFYALQSFVQWCRDNLFRDWMPITESIVWIYLKDLKAAHAAPTKAASFIESLRFSHYVLGLDGCEKVLPSARIRGLATQIYSGKRPWRPADPLTVGQVLALHNFMADDKNDLTDRICVGHFLHLLYSRSRWSDALAMVRVHLDEDKVFVEAETTIHKGARNAETKSRLLPVVAAANGIDGACWAQLYFELRKQAGLTLPGNDAQFMLPAPCGSSEKMWTDRYLTSQEANSFLKVLLTRLGLSYEHQRVTTHSFKATALTWCSKFGVDGEMRAALARHQGTTKGPTALYSRDLLTPCLRVFLHVVEAIKKKHFHPDTTRSGMLTPNAFGQSGVPGTPVPPLGAEVRHVQAIPLENVQVKEEPCWPQDMDGVIDLDPETEPSLGQEGLSESEEETDSSSESSTEETEEDRPQAPVPKRDVFRGADWYINISTLVIHARKTEWVFRCGRKISSVYAPLFEMNGLRCGKCFPDR